MQVQRSAFGAVTQYSHLRCVWLVPWHTNKDFPPFHTGCCTSSISPTTPVQMAAWERPGHAVRAVAWRMIVGGTGPTEQRPLHWPLSRYRPREPRDVPTARHTVCSQWRHQQIRLRRVFFTARRYASAVLSLCLCLQSHASILSKRLNLGSRKQHSTVAFTHCQTHNIYSAKCIKIETCGTECLP